MQCRVLIAVLVGCVAFACSRDRAVERVATPRAEQVTFVGCVEQGATRDEFVVKGRSVDQRVVATTGSLPGGVASTETMGGGDGDRNPSRGTREDWADTVSPKLVGGQDFQSELGHRVVVTGEFVPATMDQPLDQLKVASLERVANTCTTQ